MDWKSTSRGNSYIPFPVIDGKQTFPMTIRRILLLGLTFLLLHACGEVEEPLTLEEGSFENEFHEAHAGKILFQTEAKDLTELTEKDIRSSIAVSEEDDFYLRLLLAKTQTYYLQQLAPELSVNDLCKKGSYQFTFFVDGKQTFQENVQTGAGSCWFRNSVTTPLVLLMTEEEHWGKYLWTKFMKKGGGQKALENGTHQLKIEVRPYIETDELKVGDIIASGAVDLTFLNTDVDESQVAIQPVRPLETWTIAERSYDQERIRALNKRIAQNYFKKITSIVVIQDGELVLEQYYNGADRSSLHNTRSVGKTLASTVLGIAIADGHIPSEKAKLADYYDLRAYQNYSKKKGKVTLEDLLTMSSVFAGSDMDPDSPGNEENMYPTDNWVTFTLDLPMDEEKNMSKDWDYFTAGVVVLGDILNQTVPDGLEDYAEKRLFQPLGISKYTWQYTPQNVPNTAGGFQMSALDLARYGQLYIDKGIVNGQQIVPEKWIEESMSQQIEIPEAYGGGHYGYLLWNKTYEVNGESYDVYYASGNGGNKVMMFPELDLVIVITATAYGQPYMHIQADEIVEDYLLPALLGEVAG